MSELVRSWFGDFELARGQRASWRVGPLTLHAMHGAGEWRIQHSSEGSFSDQARVALGDDVQAPEEGEAARYVMADDSPHLALIPMLPDRSVVTRPVSPVFVPAGEAVRLYVGVPLWLRVEAGQPAKTLLELATLRLSDTWFGAPSALDGELCYALRSRCRLALDESPPTPARAVIPVTIRNHSSEVLVLERISVPVRQLALFVTPEAAFWGEEVVLERQAGAGEFAALRILAGAPAEALSAVAVGPSRDQPQRKTAIRAFSALFS